MKLRQLLSTLVIIAGLIVTVGLVQQRQLFQKKAAPAEAETSLSFIHQDHLGSISMVTDAAGHVVSRKAYYPYGSIKSSEGEFPTERGYTGQVSDSQETGLLYYNARYYDSVIAKFTQADKAANTLNKYAYASNNPVMNTDPSGNMVEAGGGGGGRDVADSIFGGISYSGFKAGKLNINQSEYLADTHEKATAVALRIDFVNGNIESPSNMCGPLAADILKKSGFFGAVELSPKDFWLVDPAKLNRLLPTTYFEHTEYKESTKAHNFKIDGLEVGDFLFLHGGSFGHMIVIQEIDNKGRAYAISNVLQSDGTFTIEKIMLYDPNNPSVGYFKSEWVNPGGDHGKTGMQFDIWRLKPVYRNYQNDGYPVNSQVPHFLKNRFF